MAPPDQIENRHRSRSGRAARWEVAGVQQWQICSATGDDVTFFMLGFYIAIVGQTLFFPGALQFFVCRVDWLLADIRAPSLSRCNSPSHSRFYLVKKFITTQTIFQNWNQNFIVLSFALSDKTVEYKLKSLYN